MRIPRHVGLFVVLLAACGHGEPFATPPTGSDAPLVATAPIRLTYNALVDQDPVWLPDGSAIMYSAQRADAAADACLVTLPPDGGRISATWCDTGPFGADSLIEFDTPAPSADGRVVYHRRSRGLNEVGERTDELVVASLPDVAAVTSLRSLPMTLGTRLYTGVAQVRWIAAGLIYRAGFAGLVCIDANVPCARAFVTSGLDLVRRTLTPGPNDSVVPGTTGASSLALSDDSDAVFYTLNADSRLYRLVLSTGATSVVYDFGAGNVARDVQVKGLKVYAIVGGNVVPLSDPNAGPLQWDRGGPIVVLDLASSAVSSVSSTLAFQHLALSPDGKRLVAESGGDLWLMSLP